MFNLEKNSSIIGAFTKTVVPGAFKAARGVVRAVGGGLLPTPKTAPIGKKVFGLATKGVALGGMYTGVKNTSKVIGQGSEPNYTTMLRNNVIAGNVSREELTPPDIESIQRLGMR